jgi:hypothetical protein
VTTGVTHRERRTSESGMSHHDVINSSSSRDKFGSGSGRTQIGVSGLSRLDSRSAPLPASLHITLPSGTQLQPTADSAAVPAAGSTAAPPPQSPRSDDGSVVSSTAGQQYTAIPKSPGSTGGSTTSSSTRVRFTKVLHKLSRRGDGTGPNPDDADAPPEEVSWSAAKRLV